MSFALCCSVCFLCFPLLIAPQSTGNITLGKSLTAGDGSSWVSPSGDFAFGFQQVGTGGFLLAIWFNKIPDKTVTWSANRDALAEQGSKLQLTIDGRLVLSDPNGTEMWSKAGSGVAYAAMLDTGNFVLADNNSAPIWQSFDEPTDTILPTQAMKQGTALIARLAETNYSSGRFQLIMQDDGNLAFYALNWPQDSYEYTKYFDTSTVGRGHQVVFNQSGSVYVMTENGTEVDEVLPDHVDPVENL